MNKTHAILHPRSRQLISQPQAHQSQRGFTLVEILVAMTIGLLMMAGIMQVSMANKESSRLQRNMGFVQENIRTAMDLLGRDIRLAGFSTPAPNGFAPTPPPFIAVAAPTTDTTAAITADGGAANNDQITLTHQSTTNLPATDCLNANTGVPFAENHYFISNQRLMCRGNGNPIAQPLVEGVESLQILYGENTDGDPLSANRYVQAHEVGNMRSVVSVRIAMRFISRDAVRESADTNRYALLDAAAFTPAANDRRLRREITTTISLRNQ